MAADQPNDGGQRPLCGAENVLGYGQGDGWHVRCDLPMDHEGWHLDAKDAARWPRGEGWEPKPAASDPKEDDRG